MILYINLDLVIALDKNGSPLPFNNDKNKVPENKIEYIEDFKLPSDS